MASKRSRAKLQKLQSLQGGEAIYAKSKRTVGYLSNAICFLNCTTWGRDFVSHTVQKQCANQTFCHCKTLSVLFFLTPSPLALV